MLTLYNPVEYIRHVTLLPFCKEDDFATAKVGYSIYTSVDKLSQMCLCFSNVLVCCIKPSSYFS